LTGIQGNKNIFDTGSHLDCSKDSLRKGVSATAFTSQRKGVRKMLIFYHRVG